MKYRLLRTPLGDVDVEELNVGDIVYVSGILVTARDMTHRLLIEKLEKREIDSSILDGNVIYHAGPVARKINDKWEIVSIGPTTSIRMERYIPRLLQLANVKLIVGKGGLSSRIVRIFKERKCAYGIFPGGCGIVAARCVKKVIDVLFLEELGIPEALWIIEVEKFGPIIVTIDSKGNVLK